MAERQDIENTSDAAERSLSELEWLKGRTEELLAQAKAGGADQAEVALSASRALSVTARARERESVEHEGDRGASITVYCQQRSGSASTTDLTPQGLASALERIQQGASRIDNVAAENNPATAHMFIINPLHGGGRDKLFSTHPATENRVAALKAMAAQGYGHESVPESVASRSSIPSSGQRRGRGNGNGPWR